MSIRLGLGLGLSMAIELESHHIDDPLILLDRFLHRRHDTASVIVEAGIRKAGY